MSKKRFLTIGWIIQLTLYCEEKHARLYEVNTPINGQRNGYEKQENIAIDNKHNEGINGL